MQQELFKSSHTVDELAAQLEEAHQLIAQMKQEWKELYPYDALAMALQTIITIGTTLMEAKPNLKPVILDIFSQSSRSITPALEPNTQFI